MDEMVELFKVGMAGFGLLFTIVTAAAVHDSIVARRRRRRSGGTKRGQKPGLSPTPRRGIYEDPD